MTDTFAAAKHNESNTLFKNKLKILKLPPSLTIGLVRVRCDPITGQLYQVKTDVVFEDFTEDSKLSISIPVGDGVMCYEACGFGVFTGDVENLDCGHYIAYKLFENGKWYRCNDLRITHIPDIKKTYSEEIASGVVLVYASARINEIHD